MTSTSTVAFDPEQGILELPGTPTRWIWAFTCPTPKCACRTALVLSAPGSRESLLERGRSVADAWLGAAHFGQVAQDLKDVTAFAVDLDSHALFPPAGDAPLDRTAHPEVSEVADRLDDDVLDAIARLWHRGKGVEPPPEPGANGAKIAIDGWRRGDGVLWDDAQPWLRSDTYYLGERVFEAIEVYCVDPGCDCGELMVDFSAVAPRGAPNPGFVEFDGDAATLHPDAERHRERLTELWAAYCARYPRYRERLARRSAAMHGLAGRFVAAPPKPKVGRNGLCSCGSGKKFKKCCGAA